MYNYLGDFYRNKIEQLEVLKYKIIKTKYDVKYKERLLENLKVFLYILYIVSGSNFSIQVLF